MSEPRRSESSGLRFEHTGVGDWPRGVGDRPIPVPLKAVCESIAWPLGLIRPFVASGFVLVTLILVAPPVALANAGDSDVDSAVAEEAAPKPIAASRIPSEAEAAQDTLRIIEARATLQPRIEQIIQTFPETRRVLRASETRDRQRVADSGYHRGLLYAIASDWQTRSEELSEWRSVLERRMDALAKDAQLLSEMRRRWSVTREAAVEGALSTALVERVDSTLLQVTGALETIDARLGQVLATQDQVVTLQRAADAMLEYVRTAHDSLRQHVFDIDRPPLWKVTFERDEGVWRAAAQILSDEVGRSIVYLRSQADRVVAYAILTAALALLMRWLSLFGARRAPGAPGASAAPGMLERPWSATALIMLFGTIFYFDDAPLLLLGVCVLSLIGPVLRLLPATPLASTRWAAYVLSAWMAVELMRQTFVPEPIVSRLILVFEGIVAMVLFTWLLRPSRLGLLGDTSRTLRAIGSGLRLVAPMAAVSLASNAIGNVALAELLIEGTRTALYAAYILFVLDQLTNVAWAALLGTPQAQALLMVANHGELIRERGYVWIRIGMRLLWLHIALNGYRMRSLVYDGLWNGLNARLSIGDLEIGLIDLLLAGLMVWLSFVLSRFVRFVLDEDVLPRANLPRGVPFAISTIVRYLVLVLGFMLAVAASGMDTNRFALLVGALGVGIGIGLQDVVNNFVSGLILLFERPIQLGDTVEVNGKLGDVKQIGLRSSTLRTLDGGEVVIPNSAFVSNDFTNWTLSDRMRRIELPVGVAYGTDPDSVIEVLTAVLVSHDSILDDPQPTVLFDGFGESSLDFLVRGWTADFDNWRAIRGDIGVRAIHALKEAGIEIPFPQRDLHLRSVSPELRGGGRVDPGGRAESS